MRPDLLGLQDLLPVHVPIICVSKGLEVGTGAMMSELIPEALARKQPAVFLSGPSFAKEVMDQCPTGVVAACKVRPATMTCSAAKAGLLDVHPAAAGLLVQPHVRPDMRQCAHCASLCYKIGSVGLVNLHHGRSGCCD